MTTVRLDRGKTLSKAPFTRGEVAQGKLPAIAIMACFALAPGQAALAHGTAHVVPLVTPASNTVQQGFVRIVNRSNRAGTVSIHAIDDSGDRFGPASLWLDANARMHLNSRDLELGNPDKGLSSGVGDGDGNWRLELESTLDFEALAYIRTGNGFVTSMHDVVTEESTGHYRVPFFNPGSNLRQQSRLRLVNPGARESGVTITAVDDEGTPAPEGAISLVLPGGEARMFSARQLESGDDELTGRLGDGHGKWTLVVSAEHPVQVMSLLLGADGNLTNLSRTPYEPHRPPTECEEGFDVERDDPTDRTAVLLGNLTDVATVHAREGTVDVERNTHDYYRFALNDRRRMRFELHNLTENADLYLVDLIGNVLPRVYPDYAYSENHGISNESIEYTLDAGTYHILVTFAAERGAANYHLRYSNDSAIAGRRIESAFGLGDLTDVAEVRTRDGQVNSTSNETCLYRQNYHRFTLTDTRRMWFELRNLTQNADLYLVDLIGNVLPRVYPDYAYSENDGIRDESIEYTLDAGTYHILVTAEAERGTADYRLRYSNNSVIPGRRVESAFDLGDLTGVASVRTRQGQVELGANEPDLFRRGYYRFTLTDARRMRFELRNLTQDADLYLVDLIGNVLPRVYPDYAHSDNHGVSNESIEYTLDAGTYHILVTAEERSTSSYELRYGPAG